MTSLDRRKKALVKFYEEVDPGRIKNIDPLFNHFSFSEISAALKKKYNKIPEGWDYEVYRDWVGHVNPKKIAAVMRKKGLDPTVVLGDGFGSGRKTSVSFNPQFRTARAGSALRSYEAFSDFDEESNVVEFSSQTLRNDRKTPKYNDRKTPKFDAAAPQSPNQSPKQQKFKPRAPPGPPPSKMKKMKSKVKIQRETVAPVSLIEEEEEEDFESMFNPAPDTFRSQATHADFSINTSQPPKKPAPPPPPYDMAGSPLEKQMKTSISAPVIPRATSSPNVNILPRATSLGNVAPKATVIEKKPPPPPPGNPMDELKMKVQPVETSKPANPMQELMMKVKPVESSPSSKPANPMQELLMKVKPVENAPKPANPMQELLMKVKPVENGVKPANPMQELLMRVKPVESAPPPPPAIEIKLNPEDGLDKYRKMKKAGLPDGAIINAMIRDEVDPASIDLLDAETAAPPPAPEVPKAALTKSNSPPPLKASKTVIEPSRKTDQAPIKKEETTTKKPFAAMHNKLLAAYGLAPAEEKKTGKPPPRRAGTAVSSAFADMHKKLKINGMGAPSGGANKEVKVDSEKSKDVATKFAKMAKGKDLKTLTPGTEEFEKYSKMQKTGLPEGAIRNCIERDGYDPESFYSPVAAAPAPAPVEEKKPEVVAPIQTPVATPVKQTTQIQPTPQAQPIVQQNVQTPVIQQQVQTQQMQPQTQTQMSQAQYEQAQREYEEAMRKYEYDLYVYNQQQQLLAQQQQQQLLAQQQQQQRLAQQQQTMYRPNNPQIQGSQMNPQGWSVEWSDEYKRPYYYNHYTMESSWVPPPGM